jgi:biopolymer transport protein ExbD
MIDVMFFLLVTFMLASLSMQSLNSMRVDLPKGKAPAMRLKEPITLTVTRDSRVFLNKIPVVMANVADTLRPMLAGREPRVIVNADGSAPEGVVVQAMLQARQAGVENFLIAVKRE